MNADTARLLKSLRRAGYKVSKGKKHYRCRSPDGETMLVISGTPNRSGLWHEQQKVKRAIDNLKEG